MMPALRTSLVMALGLSSRTASTHGSASGLIENRVSPSYQVLVLADAEPLYFANEVFTSRELSLPPEAHPVVPVKPAGIARPAARAPSSSALSETRAGDPRRTPRTDRRTR